MSAVGRLLATIPDGRLYQPIEHPLVAGMGVAQPCEERWAMIQRAIEGVQPGWVVDFGCHTGWFCRKLARAGWAVIGFDRSAEWIEVALEMGGGPKYFRLDLIDNSMLVRSAGLPHVEPADIGLALSVVMYLFTGEAGDEKAWAWLNNVSETVPVLFLDYGGMYATHLPADPRDFMKQVLQRTSYRHAVQLGRSALEGRAMWMLTTEEPTIRVYWVMGPSGVGKRHYCRSSLTPGEVWMDERPRTLNELRAEVGEFDSVIRWQWGREAMLREWVRRPRGEAHELILLTAPAAVVAERIRTRGTEPFLSPEACAFGAGSVDRLAQDLSEELAIPLRRVDYGGGA